MIAVQDLHSIFELIRDEAQSEFVPDSEKDMFLSQAQIWLFKRLWNPDGQIDQVGKNGYFESSVKMNEYLSPFILQITGGAFAAGKLQRLELEARITALFSITRTIVAISGMEIQIGTNPDYVPVRYKTHAEHAKQNRMAFYKPTECEPYFTISNGDYYIYPSQYTPLYRLNVLVYPPDLSSSGTIINSDFPEILAPIIAYRAAELHGVAVRDTEFVQGIQQQIQVMGI